MFDVHIKRHISEVVVVGTYRTNNEQLTKENFRTK